MKADFKILKMNFRETGTTDLLNIPPDSVPTLSPEKMVNQFMQEGEEPYFKIEAIEYPILANGWTYKESFFESFVAKLNDRVIPGSKYGHSSDWGSRPATDLLLVGGKLEKNGDGTGTVYLKNYIPLKADSDNEAFIRENKANLVHYSIVSYTRDEIIDNDDGTREFNVVESMFGERNDAVEYDMGGMDQKTNSKSGGMTPVNNGEAKMTKEEALKLLKNLMDNGKENAKDIAKALGLEVVGDVHRSNAEALGKLNKLLGDDPVAKASELIDAEKKNAAALLESKVSEAFGAESKENLVREHANSMLKTMDPKLSIDEKIQAIKENAITKKLNAQRIDPNHLSGQSERKNVDAESKTGRMAL